MTKLLSIFVGICACAGVLTLGSAGCSKDKTPDAESSSGGDSAAQKAGADIDEAADEAGDEVGHVGNDRDETVDEAHDKVDEATGAD